MRESLKAWLVDLGVITLEQPQLSRLQRVLSMILLVAILGGCAFAWIQYREAQNLAQLTSQDFTGFEWDAVKLEFRTLQMHTALRDAVHEAAASPNSLDALTDASTQYNLFAAQVQLMAQRAPIQGIDDEPSFKVAMSYASAFMRQADPLLEELPTQAMVPALQVLLPQADALRTQMYQLLVAAHDLRLLRSKKLVDEVARANAYFAALSAFVVVLGAGWALSAMRNLRLSAQQRDELKNKFEESSFSASHDFLTGLANRRLLLDQLDHAMARSKRHNTNGAIIMIDLDDFKPVNDRYGHNAGDLLLVEVARRIKKGVRDLDTVARVGGDEFVVLLSQIDGQPESAGDAADAIAQKLLAALSEPYVLTPPGGLSDAEAVTCRCTASMGVSIFSKDTTNVEELLRQADVAMYRAKQAGGARVDLAA